MPGSQTPSSAENAIWAENRHLFMETNVPKGPEKLMVHEGTQMAIALGIAREKVDFLFQDWVFIPPKCVSAESLTLSGILDENAPPLMDVFLKDDTSPLHFSVVVPEGDLPKVPQVFEKFAKHMVVGEFNVLVLTDREKLLFEGGMELSSKLPWGLEKISKVHRMVATTAGSHVQAWYLSSTPESRQRGGEPLFKVVRILSPGLEPRRVFVEVPQQPENLWVFCVPFAKVPSLISSSGIPMSDAVVLPGPASRLSRWVLLRDIQEAAFLKLKEEFYECEGSAFCSYDTFKGNFPPKAEIIQIFWRKQMRTPENLNIFWRSVDYQLKQFEGQWKSPPQLQWVGANKIRMALASQEDFGLFVGKILPTLKQRGMVFKDEKSGNFLDDDGTSSVSGQSSLSGASISSARNGNEAIVITDLPDFFRPGDVESVVRTRLKSKQVVGGDVISLHIKQLEWSMGSPLIPTWQVGGRGVDCLVGDMLDYRLGNGRGTANVLSWKEYSTARAAWRSRAQAAPIRRPDTAASSASIPAGPPPPMASEIDLEMEVDRDGVRAKRVRNDE
jgi:hypothetical protein